MEDQSQLGTLKFRNNIVGIQNAIQGAIDRGEVPSTLPLLSLRHFFTPVSEKYRCCIYGREIFFPAGNIVIGKIHKHWTINFVMKGKVKVGTEDGPVVIEAPDIFVSGPGTQRIGYIVEDTLWATVHLTEHDNELRLAEIEDELIAKNYDELDKLYAERLGLENK